MEIKRLPETRSDRDTRRQALRIRKPPGKGTPAAASVETAPPVTNDGKPEGASPHIDVTA
jgi:hypothetical protein